MFGIPFYQFGGEIPKRVIHLSDPAVYLLLISNNISILTLAPILLLLVFVFTILKISMRANMEGLDRSQDNISSVDTL